MKLRKKLLSYLFIALALFYLFFHAMHGKQGIYSMMREKHNIKKQQEELAKITRDRQQLEKKVEHLRDESLDRDLLDEQVRRMLGRSGKDELVVDP